MGHSAGRLFTHDHLAVTYEHVVELTARLRERIEASDVCDDDLLPPRSLVILGRLGAHFHFITCVGGDDSPVFMLDLDEGAAVPILASVMDWLRLWQTEALAAIASGYFDHNPDGTTP